MRFKLDENVTGAAVAVLARDGHEVDTVADEDIVGATDDALIAAASADQRMLVTFDVGLGDLRRNPVGSHAGVVLLRLIDQRPDVVVAVLGQLVDNHDLSAMAGSLVVVTERLVRIRRP